MERLEAALEHLFAALQVADPTNYLPNAPQHQAQNEPNPARRQAAQPPPNDRVPQQPADEEQQAPNRSCPICLDELSPAGAVTPGPCAHSYCAACLPRLCADRARAHSVVPCAVCVQAHDIEALLPHVVGREAQEALGDAYALRAAGNVAYCAACGEAVADTQPGAPWTCPCGERNAPPGSVADAQLGAIAAAAGWVSCPSCGQLTSKADDWSCNHTRCVCGQAFCMRCGAAYRSDRPHGNAGNQHGLPGCDCGLYQRD